MPETEATATAANAAPRPLMLGYGWFPDRLGGLNRYFRDLVEHMPEASGLVIGAAPDAPARVVGVSEHELPLGRRLRAFWRAAQAAAERADVVNVHFALYSLAPLWLGRLRRKPVVLHFHGPWADENVAAGDRSTPRRAARRLLERAAYCRADEAIVLSSAFRQVLVERYGVRPWSVNVVPPGVDLDRFSPGSIHDARERLALEPDAFIAVAVRRLMPRMGLEVLLEAWGDAVERLPSNSSLLIAGDGPLRDALTAAVARHSLENSVRLLGRVDERRLVELYRAADVAVVPSLDHEGFGLVALEAAACGTPSIVSETGGLPEAIHGLDPSLVIPAGDAAVLRERLIEAQVKLPSRAAARGHAERFDWATVAERHRRIMRRTTAGFDRDERLKVVYLDHVAQMSGGEIALLRLLPHLERVNAHVVLAADGPLVGQLHLAGISTEVLPMGDQARKLRKGEVRGRGVSAAAAGTAAVYVLRLAARLRQLQPDLVHANSLKAGVYGSAAARLAGVPLIWHVRDRIAEDYLPRSAVKLVRGMTRQLASAVVANSHATLDTIATPEKSSAVVYSVLPEVVSKGSALERQTNGALTYGVVGRLAPWKGQDFFLRAFAHAFPDGDERAVIVGAALFGEDEYAASLPQTARELGIGDRVELRGHRSDVWEELSRIHVLVHSSITPEPFGQVILEGMAAGVPVVAADAGGPAEILEHLSTGLLYEPNDLPGLAAAMRRMRDPNLREGLSAAARKALDPYAPRVVAAELQDLYATVAARGTRRN